MERIKRVKGISIVLLFMMVLQLMMPVNFAYGDTLEGEQPLGNKGDFSGTTTGAAIQAFGIGPQSDLGNIFGFKSMKIGGKEVENGSVIDIDADTVVDVEYSWDTNGLNAKPNDTASTRLSDAFKDVEATGDVKVDGEIVGMYIVKDGVLSFVFNENITKDNVQNGWVKLGLKFDLEKFKENIVQEIPFYESGSKNIKVIAKPGAVIADIGKQGHANTEKDATYITWTVDVINNTDKKINGANVTDTLPAGLGAPKSFVIKKLNIGLNGSKTAGETVFKDKQSFNIELGDMDPYTGYRIEYVTDIGDYTKQSFSNSAVFDYYGKVGGLPAVGTVNNIQRSNPIEKSGEQKGKTADGRDLISWTIDVNKNGQIIPNAFVDDVLPAGLDIDVTSIEVVEIAKSGANWVEGASHPNEATFTNFPIELGNLDKNEAYRIKFNTTVDWTKVNAGVYKKANGFENTATLYHDEVKEGNEVNKDDDTVDINRAPILKKAGVQKVDYTNKTITWTVTVNEAGHPLDTVTITDILPKGLQLTTGSGIGGYDITIKDQDKNPFAPNSLKATPDGDKTKLEIILEDVGNKKIIITYTTKITDFSIDQFINGVGMTGTGIGTDFGSTKEEREVKINPSKNVYKKEYTGVDYDNKQISWKLTVDPVREGIQTGFVITDTFTNDGLILLPETVKVMLGTVELKEVYDDYALAPRETGYQHGFIITVNKEIKGKQLVVTYDTSYDPAKGILPHNKPTDNAEKEIYRNKSVFTGITESGVGINQSRDAYHKVRTDSWNSGKKEGQLFHVDGSGKVVNDWTSGFERKIAWQVYINYQKQSLGNDVSVTDTLAYNGKIDKDGIKVSVYDVDKAGDTTIRKEAQYILKRDIDYKIEDSADDKTFTLTFLIPVSERYVVEFTTSVPDMSSGTYTNDATVDVNGTKYPYKKSIGYDKSNTFLEKSSIGVKDKEVFTDDEVNWKVTVNESLSIIHNAEIKDTISNGHVYKNGSLKIYKIQNKDKEDKDKFLVVNEDYELKENGNVLTIKLLNNKPLEDTLVLEYVTVVTTKDGQIGNTVEIKGNELLPVTRDSEKLKARLFSEVGGEWAKNKGALRVTKIDAETKETIVKNKATFTLWYMLNDVKVQYGDSVYETKNGILEIGNLPLRTYYLREVTAPDGYVKSVKDLEIAVENPVGNDKNNPVVAEGSFENTKEKTGITAEKEWNNGSDARPTIWFKLFRQVGNEKPQEVPGTEIKKLENGTTSAEWKDLDKTDIDGKIYKYSVKEVDSQGNDFAPENYVKAENGLTVTNNYNSPEDASATAKKVWDGLPEDRNIEKPTVWFKLYRYVGDGEPEEVPGTAIKELTDGTTEVVWIGLVKTDAAGKEYSFLVKEVDADGSDFVPENYKKSEDGLTVTNTYTKRDVTATKVWDGGASPRPTIWFELYRQIEGGELEKVDVAIQELVDGTTEVTWEDVDKTDGDGNEYIYSVKEVDAAGNDFVPSEYTKTESGLTVTNTRKPTGGGGGTTPVYGKVTVKKVDEDKKVLSGAEFTLYDSKGKVVGKAVTGSDGTVSFEELEPGEYVLKETKAPEGYVLDEKETDVTISANKTSSYTITNRKEEPKKPGRIEIIKTDEEGKLLSDAWFSLIDEKGSTLQNAGTVNGRVAFEDVPVGRYTVKEVQAPEGYELSGKAVTVTVESNKTVELSFVNKKSGTPVVPANGRITINKVDENSNALAGAEFTLYDENNRIVETAVTDKDGKVVFESLKDGRYFVKETKAPEGYVLVNEAKIVDIAGGQIYSYKFKNVPESVLIEDSDVPMGWETIDEPDVPKGVGTLPNTGYILNTWMLAALGLLLIAEGLFLRKRRKITN